jgi:HK97 family phage major capsid protein
MRTEDRELSGVIGELGTAFGEFRAANDRRIDEIEKKFSRARLYGGLGDSAPDGATGASRETKAAYGAFLRRGDLGELKAMSVGSDPDGGVTVVDYLAPTIYRLMQEISPVRQLARIIRLTGSGTFEEVQDRGSVVGASWVGETESRPVTASPQLGKLSIPACEMYAMPEVTQTLLDDNAVDLESYLGSKLAEQFAVAEGQAFWNGAGMNSRAAS